MLQFEETQLIHNQVFDLDNGTYEVKYKVDTDETAMIWVYYENENKEYEQIRGSPFSATFDKSCTGKSGTMEGDSLQKYITENLDQISNYLEKTRENIYIKDMEGWTDDVDKLLKIKKNLHTINERRDEIYLTLDMIEQTLRHLEELQISKGKDISKTRNLKQTQKTLH